MAGGSAAFCARIHRGAQQLGGSCVELAADGERIVLDIGLPLDADEATPELLPSVAGLRSPDLSLRAIVISHGHGDHWGLAPYASHVPLAMGAATQRILSAAAPFVPHPFVPKVTFELADRKAMQIGPFNITPFLVDHSAFDAYALLVEAGGRRLFYSGDIRAHGRKSKLFERLVAHPPPDVHAMLMEGSSLGRLEPNGAFPAEGQIEERFVETFRSAPGFIVVSASAQNIDRIVSLYRACKRTERTLLLDLYAVSILEATGSPHIPRPGWPNIAVYLPDYQRRQIKRTERFDLIEPIKPYRIYSEDLAKIGQQAVMLFRPAMTPDVEKAGLWPNTTAIWSQWSGYLEDGAGLKLKTDMAGRGIELNVIHTSGHASIADLRRLSEAIKPAALVPIHTFAGDQFSTLFSNVVRRQDGEWWEV